jgi:hypothetical protein
VPVKEKVVNDKYQAGYRYFVTEPVGTNFDPHFKPELTPKEMLELGVFSGQYFQDKPSELPKEWFKKARLSTDGLPHHQLNFFQVSASQPLDIWLMKGWIHPDDPRGWFQWYCRYYLGRRLDQEDQRQIKRWLDFKRHIGQIKKHCAPGDLTCRMGQRQALLHWAYDSRKI